LRRPFSITFQKRQKEPKRQEKQRAKAERREQRKAANRAEEAQRTPQTPSSESRRRAQLVKIRTKMYNQIRDLLKTFGVVLGPGKGSTFGEMVLRHLPQDPTVRLVIRSLFETWTTITAQLKTFDREIERIARNSDVCKRLMTTPGVGPVTAVAFLTTIDNPHRFSRSQDVGAYLGLTPRRYQSGEVDRAGHISKSRDAMMRSYLVEAAHTILAPEIRVADVGSCVDEKGWWAESQSSSGSQAGDSSPSTLGRRLCFSTKRTRASSVARIG
jgi:transposase